MGAPKNLPRLTARASAWLLRGNRPVLGERHLAILESVRECGSLNVSAKRLGISYRYAWGKIRQAEAALGLALITAQTGGRRGGGSQLTAAGTQIVARLRAFHQEQRHAAMRAAAMYFGGSNGAATARGGDGLRLATTTSVVDSGLLPALLEPFMQRTGIHVEVLAVGSGAALQLARRGRADAVLAHAPDAEARALRAGHLLNHRRVMLNDFVIVGPASDPARVRRAGNLRAALQRIASGPTPFFSRHDDSGTNQCERALLAAAGIAPGSWYQRHRSGMATLLQRASAAGAYALTDGGTFAALRDQLSLAILSAADQRVINPYSVLATSPHRHPEVNYLAAMALIAWLTAPPAQELIASYRAGGQPVARPAAYETR